jgi:hypothetical protein
MVSNTQMPLNELNKSKSMLVRNLFRKGKRKNKCRKRRKEFYGKMRKFNTQNKNKKTKQY